MRIGLDRAALAIAIGAGLALAVVGVRFGTFTAGGSDSYCYANGAELLARGAVMDVEPLAADPGWPGSRTAFAPTGHAATPSGIGAVPICPSGYPLLMALARTLGGREAMFFVTPVLGALLVLLAFVLGQRLAGATVGAASAVLTAASPIVLYQVVQPMSDIPAAAAWCAVLVAATTTRWSPGRRASAAGLCAGLAVTIRPNLLPLAVVAGLGLGTLPRDVTLRDRLRSVLIFALSALPGLLFVLAIQHAMYGSPLRSGYGDLDYLFKAASVWPNLQRYSGWLIETQTPLVVLALAAPLLLPHAARRLSAFLLVFVITTLLCYLPYVVFDAWWYLRFLLPALAPLIVLALAALATIVGRKRPLAGHLVVAGVAALLSVHSIRTADARQAFELQHLEARFRSAGAFVATLPPNAIIVTEFQSGSVRFYSGRSSVLWGEIDPARLPEALDFLRQRGRKPYFLFERWEEAGFRERFGARHPLGTLEWPPVADIDRAVRVFDPDDYARYMRGEHVRTEQIITRRR